MFGDSNKFTCHLDLDGVTIGTTAENFNLQVAFRNLSARVAAFELLFNSDLS